MRGACALLLLCCLPAPLLAQPEYMSFESHFTTWAGVDATATSPVTSSTGHTPGSDWRVTYDQGTGRAAPGWITQSTRDGIPTTARFFHTMPPSPLTSRFRWSADYPAAWITGGLQDTGLTVFAGMMFAPGFEPSDRGGLYVSFPTVHGAFNVYLCVRNPAANPTQTIVFPSNGGFTNPSYGADPLGLTAGGGGPRTIAGEWHDWTIIAEYGEFAHYGGTLGPAVPTHWAYWDVYLDGEQLLFAGENGSPVFNGHTYSFRSWTQGTATEVALLEMTRVSFYDFASDYVNFSNSSQTLTPQACCLSAGACQNLPAGSCASLGGTWHPGEVCLGDADQNGVDDVCQQACCGVAGDCVETSADLCVAASGSAHGHGSACSGALEACCLGDGSCSLLDPLCCAAGGGVPLGPDSTCAGDLNENGFDDACEESCCLPGGACVDTIPSDCTLREGTPRGPGTACSPAPEACCLGGGVCMDIDPQCCLASGGTVMGPGSACAGDPGGNGIDDACDCGPTEDGQACKSVPCVTLGSDCLPTLVRADLDPQSAVFTILDCACADQADCHVELDPNGSPVCAGDCRPGHDCVLTVSNNGDGTADYQCQSVPRPGVMLFEETFEPGWFGDGMGSWTKEGASHPEIAVADFTASDPRLGEANASSSGGLHASAGQYGAFTGGDNGEVYLDFHMPVPPGEYAYEISFHAQINWDAPSQPWGAGLEFYIGDAACMEYGSQLPHQAPLGPWIGQSWSTTGSQDGTWLQSEVLWNGSDDWDYGTRPPIPDINGQWQRFVCLSSVKDGSDSVVVTSQDETSEIIFRVVMRDKSALSQSMAFALDDLVIALRSFCPIPFADADMDSDVDQMDFAVWQRCATGDGDPAGAFDPEACACFDRDGDTDIDIADLNAFRVCISGPDVPADPACGDPQ